MSSARTRQAVSAPGASCQSWPEARKLQELFGLRTPGGGWGWSSAPHRHSPAGLRDTAAQQLLVQPGQFPCLFLPCLSSPACLTSSSIAPAPGSSTAHSESEHTLACRVGVLGPWEFCLQDSKEGRGACLETLLFLLCVSIP